jgi:hypothetical protein
LLVVLSACASLPHDRTQRGLYVDARKALNGEHRVGWTVDRIEIEEAAAQTEPSACRVEESKRDGLLSWLRMQIAAEGGPAKARFERGDELSDLDELIEMERTLALLENVEQHVPSDCPFWSKPEAVFDGEHSVARRFLVIAESMGAGSLLIQGGTVSAAGGGSARLLAGYGFASRLELAAGIEGGGDAVLAKDEAGSLSPEGAFRFGAPIWLRLHDVDRIYDVELAVITRLKNGEFSQWGGRFALGGGVTGLRRLGIMPALELWLGYEMFPNQGDDQMQHVLRLGTRVGFDYGF